MNGRGEQMDDLIKRQDAITAYCEQECGMKGMTRENCGATDCGTIFDDIPSAQPEDYTELKREFLRMASYIDVLLECSDEQKETLMGFISRLAEFMPWTERD